MLYDQIQETLAYLRTRTDAKPRVGIILGTGLGNLTHDLTSITAEIPYRDIPNFPISTVESHKGKLIFGELNGVSVVVMAGRFHYYEGYTMRQITFPVRVMKFLGIESIVITNVSGSVNADIEAGDIVIVRDHLNFLPENPLRGDNDERLGVRFPDMLRTYDKDLINKTLEIAEKNNIRIHTGVYLALAGPNLETPAEYEMAHRIGADLVGMSTVPEVLVARHADLKILVLSLASNKSFPIESIKETTLEEVIAVATEAEPKMRQIIKEVLQYCV